MIAASTTSTHGSHRCQPVATDRSDVRSASEGTGSASLAPDTSASSRLRRSGPSPRNRGHRESAPSAGVARHPLRMIHPHPTSGPRPPGAAATAVRGGARLETFYARTTAACGRDRNGLTQVPAERVAAANATRTWATRGLPRSRSHRTRPWARPSSGLDRGRRATSARSPTRTSRCSRRRSSTRTPSGCRDAVDAAQAAATRGCPRTVLVTAPAGYGKTTLLAQWAAAERRPVAWVSLDARDSDPVVFLRHVLAAVTRVEVLDPRLFASLRAPTNATWAPATRRCLRAVAACGEPYLLVLDNVDLLHSNESRRLLSALLDDVATGRRLRSLQGSCRSCASPASEQAALSRRSASMSSRSAPERRSCFYRPQIRRAPSRRGTNWWTAAKAGPRRCISAPSRSGTAPRRPPRWRTSAAATASSPTTSAPSTSRTSTCEGCASCAGSRRSGNCPGRFATPSADRRLGPGAERIARANLLLVQPGRGHGWFRIHPLLRDLLQRELAELEPQLIRPLNLRAADWYERRGELETALCHADAAGVLDRVATTIATTAFVLSCRGRDADAGTMARALRHGRPRALSGRGDPRQPDPRDARASRRSRTLARRRRNAAFRGAATQPRCDRWWPSSAGRSAGEARGRCFWTRTRPCAGFHARATGVERTPPARMRSLAAGRRRRADSLLAEAAEEAAAHGFGEIRMIATAAALAQRAPARRSRSSRRAGGRGGEDRRGRRARGVSDLRPRARRGGTRVRAAWPVGGGARAADYGRPVQARADRSCSLARRRRSDRALPLLPHSSRRRCRPRADAGGGRDSRPAS